MIRQGVVASLLLLALAPPPAAGQRRGPRPDPRPDREAPARPVRSFAGLSGLYARPAGEFGDQVEDGWGLGGHFLHRVDEAGVFGIRLDGGFVNYGRERRAVQLSPTVGGRITVDLETSNDVLFLGAGPQLMVPGSRVRPYLNAQAGVSYFLTQSSLRGDSGDRFGETNNFDDLAFSYGGGAGVYVPLARGRNTVSLDVGVEYRNTGEVRYLREGSIVDRPDGTIAFEPIVSDADLVVYRVGLSVGLRDGDRRRGR